MKEFNDIWWQGIVERESQDCFQVFVLGDQMDFDVILLK